MSFLQPDINDLEYWSGQTASKAGLPLIVSRLARATTPALFKLLIPKGKSTYQGGWDGEIICGAATEFIPAGTSFWEFGTERGPKGKAEREYQKRTLETEEATRLSSAFVFVTTRAWKSSRDWSAEKLKEGRWRDVRVIEGDLLVEWLSLSIIISQQLFGMMGRKTGGRIESPQQFWDNWSSGPQGKRISPKLVLAGRTETAKHLVRLLQQPPSLIPIQASGKEEAIAFMAAALMAQDELSEGFFAKMALVNDEEDFKVLMQEKKPGILVPGFKGASLFYRAVTQQHHVVLPMGADDKLENAGIIVLPKLGREEILEGLQEMGLSEEQGRRLSRETGRNITIIRRQLGFTGTEPRWADVTAFRELSAALLAGRWHDNQAGDQLILAHIAGTPYETFEAALKKWSLPGDAPLTHIGHRWQLSSPLDAWTYLGLYCPGQQLELLGESFLVACGDIKPYFDLEPDQRPWAAFYGKLPDFSERLREGLTQSMILIALFGESYHLDLPASPQLWVDGLVARLCGKYEENLWKSLNDILPLLAEASPRAFLASLERFLQQEPARLQQIFEAGGGLISPAFYHTGLLWALESLAWLPEYLHRCCLALASLHELDPGVKIQNRPINSLHQILHPWMAQTYGGTADRIAAIKLIKEKHPETCLQLCLALLPSNSRIAQPTNKLRWRSFSQDAPAAIDDSDYNAYLSFLAQTLIELCGHNASRIACLFDHTRDLSGESIDLLLNHTEACRSEIEDPGEVLRTSLRSLLHNQYLSYRAQVHLSPEVIERTRSLYDHFSPEGPAALLYLFDDSWPLFPEGFGDTRDDPNAQQEFIRKKRLDALHILYKAYPFDEFLELPARVKQPGIFGAAAAHIPLKPKEQLQFIRLSLSAEPKQAFAGIHYIGQYYFKNGLEASIKLYRKLEKSGIERAGLVMFLKSLRPEYPVWQFIETLDEPIQNEYWQQCEANFWDSDPVHQVYTVQRLKGHGRFYSAIEVCSYHPDSQASATLAELLEQFASSPLNETEHPDPHRILRLMEELGKRADIDESRLARLEWTYLELLTRRYPAGRPLILFRELSSNPNFFVEVLCFLYLPEDDDELLQQEQEGLDPEYMKTRAEKAYRLLEDWDIVPGCTLSDDGGASLDDQRLREWVAAARKLAAERKRAKKADLQIGKILGKYPENTESWPPDAIAGIIEAIDSNGLRSNFRTSIINKRGSSSRSPFAGGQRERDLVAYFRGLGAAARSRFPVTASILEDVAVRFVHDAQRQDDDATINDLE